MCLIAQELDIDKEQEATFNKYLGEIFFQEKNPNQALFFLQYAKQFYLKERLMFLHELEEITTLQVIIHYKTANTLEKYYPNETQKLLEVQFEVSRLENEVKAYRESKK